MSQPVAFCDCAFPAPCTTPGQCGDCLRWTDAGFRPTCGFCGLPPQDACPVMGVPCDPNGLMKIVSPGDSGQA